MILYLMAKGVVGNIRRVKHQRRKLFVLKPIRLRVKHPTIWQKGICGVARYTIGLCCSNRQVWTNMNGLRGQESIAATSTTSKKRTRVPGRKRSQRCLRRSEERRVGKESVSTCRSRWSP